MTSQQKQLRRKGERNRRRESVCVCVRLHACARVNAGACVRVCARGYLPARLLACENFLAIVQNTCLIGHFT